MDTAMNTAMNTGITVTGVGKAAAPPDVLGLELGAEMGAAGVQEALEGASAALNRMRQVLLDYGVAGEDVSSGEVQVWPAYDDRQRVTGYTATLRLSVSLRDLDTAGSLVSQAVRAGGDAARIYGMSLRHSDPAVLARRARDAAWADATARAAQYAALAGRALGAVIAVHEESDEPPRPMGGHYFSLAAAEDATNLPVQPGSSSVRVSVDVRWEFAG